MRGPADDARHADGGRPPPANGTGMCTANATGCRATETRKGPPANCFSASGRSLPRRCRRTPTTAMVDVDEEKAEADLVAELLACRDCKEELRPGGHVLPRPVRRAPKRSTSARDARSVFGVAVRAAALRADSRPPSSRELRQRVDRQAHRRVGRLIAGRRTAHDRDALADRSRRSEPRRRLVAAVLHERGSCLCRSVATTGGTRRP